MRTICFVGDIHAGSHVGLWPVSELPANSRRYVGCRYLMDCWADFVKSVPKLDLLILMGDLIDGKQPKSKGVGIFSADLGEQADMATQVLAPLAAKATKTIRVWGTPYHESYDQIFSGLDTTLGVSKAAQVIDLRLANGKILNLAHHPAGGSAIYKGTTADRETLWATIAAAHKKVPDCRWLARGHKHDGHIWDTPEKTFLGVPCWQLTTAHAVKQNYFRWQPTIGAAFMYADSRHESGYLSYLRTYPLPTARVTTWGAL